MISFEQNLAAFYVAWSQKLDIAMDVTRPIAERLAAMNWIDDEIGGERTTADTLDKICDELRNDN